MLAILSLPFGWNLGGIALPEENGTEDRPPLLISQELGEAVRRVFCTAEVGEDDHTSSDGLPSVVVG